MPQITQSVDRTKSELRQDFARMLDRLFEFAESSEATPRSMEVLLWKEIIAIGGKILMHMFALFCRRASEVLIEKVQAESKRAPVYFRMDRDYWAELRTTFGCILFPWFAFRTYAGGAWVTHTPARAKFAYHKECRSSPLCLEWEVRLGMDHPFRMAQHELGFYTHGALSLEDTTIRDHLVAVSVLINRADLYLTVEQIRDILKNRATLDRVTGKPILYLSSDAVANRRYIDETWDSQWKMVNGMRLWCEDRCTGKTIHIGGEYTWGDCHAVRHAFEWLIEQGIVPNDGNYGEGVVAQLTWISDGMPWFEEHVLPLFDDIRVILDVYHVLERLAAFLALVYGQGTPIAQKLYAEFTQEILGESKPKKRSQKRKGHPKTKPGDAHKNTKAHDRIPDEITPFLALRILKIIWSISLDKKLHFKAQVQLVNYLHHNSYRMDYPSYRKHGYQIGSGAMESLHRQGNQARLKIPGARWLEETSQAIFNFRMLRMVGNWDTFWNRSSFDADFAAALLKSKASKSNHSNENEHLFKNAA